MGSKLRHDATVDISILLASLVLVNTPLVTLPLRLVTSPLLVLPGQRWSAWRGRAMQVRRKGVVVDAYDTTNCNPAPILP